ncbi:thiol reductant ABC exporter subunit CydC [Dyella caseinilytica]|uniref:Thiol reductant ABC exporter subunit CydC n=1 Tax=Dyella caseinilytica TaxID=1849581 RepID=A0ABX7GUI1_9GAMM|nr:thiol reductant ABC exporter subunit CydC [Dyella caseinilytica]QRN52895.1 thiol reductant ABC exporter subunit CydC [Dyella caseinilytica]GGA09655.1 thiol reductant ABC exporter subunit CydC [Dyella caseinilytica]
MRRADAPASSLLLARRLLALLRTERGWMLTGTMIALLSTLAGIGLIAVSGHFITAMALAGASGAAINYYTPAALIRLLAIVRTLGRYLERLITHDATLRLLARLRSWLFARLAPLAPARLTVLRSAELFSRLRADIDALEHAYLGIAIPAVTAITVMFSALIVALIYMPWLGACLAALFAVSAWYLPWQASQHGKKPGAETVACAEALRELTADGLRGRAELVLYGAEAMHAERIVKMTAQQQQARRKLDGLQAMGSAGVMLCAQLAVIGALALGLPALHEGTLAGPDLVMLALLAQASFEAVAPLPEAWAQWGATLASAQRVFALADTPPAIEEPAQVSPTIEHFDLSIRQLRLRYNETASWALDGVNLDLPQGARLALVGPSGAGKSSLMGALLRFYPFEGRIALGGIPLENLGGDEVRSHIAVVEQQPYLFDASLRENLKLGRPDVTDEELRTVITQARLDSYVDSLPHGLDTWVGENGIRVSGGEARRIAIARALLMDAPILILDEPTEGLDAVTANELYDSIAVAARGRSLLVITHRLGKLCSLVDEVAVMRDGRVVERLPVEAYRSRFIPDAQTMHEPSSTALS